MKSKALIEKQLRKKTNSILVKTAIAAKKNKDWLEISGVLTGLSKDKVVVNLSYIDKESKEGDIIVVPGKVLSMGELTKKIKIVAVNASESAIEKINNAKSTFSTILEEIKLNPTAKGVKILK